MPARHVYLLVPARHCACSARLPTSARSALCLLGTFTYVPARHRPASQRSSPGCPTYGSLTGKKQGGHFAVEPHAHAKPCEKPTCQNDMFKIMSCKNKLFHVSCKKTSCSTCHAKKQAVPHVMPCKKPHAKPCKKSKLFHMSCKNHEKCGAYGAPTRRTLTVPRVLAIRAICAIWVSHGKPLVPCYMCYMCYTGLTRQATEHPLSPGSLLYLLYVLYGIEACVLYT